MNEPRRERTEPKQSNQRLNHQGWALWALTSVVAIALTVTVVMLYIPLLRAVVSDSSNGLVQQAYYAIVGLSGLVLIFCLFTAVRHMELNRTRHALSEEEHETHDAQTRLSELSALFQVTTTLNLQLSLDVILEIIVRRVVSTLKAQQASIMVYNPESGLLETRASYGLESEFARNARKRIGEGIAGWVAQQQQPVLLQQRPNGELGQHFKNDRNITSALSLPLRVGERCVGVLNVNRINHPEPFHERHRDLLNLFAEHVGAVIERAETMDRLGSRSRELERDNRRLHEANDFKDLFLSTASHELKTPLTSVIAYAELLDDNDGKLSVGQRHEFLRRLRGEAERLLALIEDILDLTRLESGKMGLRRSRIAVNEIAHAAIETTRTMAGKRRVVLREVFHQELPPLWIDEVKLRQAVVNLVVNAVKFSPEGGDVAVLTEREPKYVKIEVSDRGPGIRPEEATHIFDLFGQGVDTQSGVEAGLGIGLHLVKRIAELHGGHAGVNSIPGEGSHFWIRLPLSLAEPGEAEQPAPQAPVADRLAA